MVPLTATPTSLDFESPAAIPETLTATTQDTNNITARGASCAAVSPPSLPPDKSPGNSVYPVQFAVTPVAVGNCMVVLSDMKSVVDSIPVNVGAAGDMFFVAHEDDDLLFMNPDIAAAFAAGQYITTVYITAGSCPGVGNDGAYYLTREAGALAAYAKLAGVANEWTVTDQPVRELRLTAQPRVSLVFFRLPESNSEAGDVCAAASTNLKGLWNNGLARPDLALTSLDGAHSYTRDHLIAAITSLIRRWHPTHIGTLDASGMFGDGTDPSDRQIFYPGLNGGSCYYYDHSDHYYSALFTGAASDAYGDVHTLSRFRGYNHANDAPNLGGNDLTTKFDVFKAYADHDDLISGPPYEGLYPPWLQRRYDADLSPAPVQSLCGQLGFAQAASSSTHSGQPLAQQPIVQLQDADGANQAIAGVEVSALLVLKHGIRRKLATVTTDAAGHATFRGLDITAPAGQYPLEFTAPHYVKTRVQVDVTSAP
jgi:hypothetical protein